MIVWYAVYSAQCTASGCSVQCTVYGERRAVCDKRRVISGECGVCVVMEGSRRSQKEGGRCLARTVDPEVEGVHASLFSTNNEQSLLVKRYLRATLAVIAVVELNDIALAVIAVAEHDTTLTVIAVVHVLGCSPSCNSGGQRNLRLSQVHPATLAVIAVVELTDQKVFKLHPNDRVTPCRGVGAFDQDDSPTFPLPSLPSNFPPPQQARLASSLAPLTSSLLATHLQSAHVTYPYVNRACLT